MATSLVQGRRVLVTPCGLPQLCFQFDYTAYRMELQDFVEKYRSLSHHTLTAPARNVSAAVVVVALIAVAAANVHGQTAAVFPPQA